MHFYFDILINPKTTNKKHLSYHERLRWQFSQENRMGLKYPYYYENKALVTPDMIQFSSKPKCHVILLQFY